MDGEIPMRRQQMVVALLVPSVRHTGTWFTIQLFMRQGWKQTHPDLYPMGPETVYHAHVERERDVDTMVKLAGCEPMVIPFRHPFRVEESWRRREKHCIHNEQMLFSYRMLIDKILPLNPLIMPVDADINRDEALEALSAKTGVELTTDWLPINSKKQSHGLPFADLTPSPEIISITKELEPVLKHWYLRP